jgi:opacity protein-like surface antigen
MIAANQKLQKSIDAPNRYYLSPLLLMKKLSILTSVLIGFIAVPLQAGGPEVYKQVAPPPPPLYGVGFYGGIDLGANVYQNRGGDRTFTDTNPDSDFFGDTLEVSPKNDVGFFGGIKLGYVFLTGLVRPTFEGDFFYNGFKGGADFTLREPDGDVIRSSSTDRTINTGAFMGNFILRFAPGNQRFQPYAGAGVGVYYAESAGTEFTAPNGETFNTGGGKNHADFAWQVVAGSDYFFTPKFSAFIEYKYLDYTSSQLNTHQNRDLGQHLVGAGVRLFFP